MRIGGALLVVATVLCAGSARAQPNGPPSPSPPSAPLPPPIVPPKLVSTPDIAYPEGATGSAEVRLVVVIGEDGVVQSATPEEGTEPFAAAAVRVVRGWRYEPATRGGLPIRARIHVLVVFRPPEPDPEPAPATDDAPSEPAPKPKPPQTEEVTVRGARAEPGRTASLSRSEVRQIPGAFGDPFRAIEIMPGVTPIVTGLPFFFVRGAPPGNVGYYLDGVRIPLLFHVGVGPSVVHPALVQRVDLYPGGYPARFGRFSGGIVSGETAPPLKELHGEYNLRLFDAGAMVEAPFANKKGTVLLGGRYSYTAFLLTQIASNTVLDYWDYQARATYDITPKDTIGVFAFGSYDFLGEVLPSGQTLTVFGTEFHRIDARYDRKLGEDGAVRVGVTTGFDRSRAQEDRFVRDRILAARSEWAYRLSQRVLARAGTDVQIDSYDVQVVSGTLSPSAARIAGYFPTRSDLGLGARADAVIAITPRLEITPGVRTDLYASQGSTAVAVDPRLALRTAITDKARILSALGIAHQPPAFVVPVPGFQPGGLRGGLQKAFQESIGVEIDLAESTTLTATAFHNAFSNMSDPLGTTQRDVVGCPPGLFPGDSLAGDRMSQPTSAPTCGIPRFPVGTIGPDRSGGGQQGADSRTGQQAANVFEIRTEGSAYGLEIFLKRKLTSRLGGFLSYTLSRSVRRYGGSEYIATFDRTHVLNVAVAFDLGRNWRAGTRVTFYTGLPKAPDPTSDDTRLPPFFRADLRLEKRWQLGQKTWISAIAEWMNATLSKEAVSTRCTLAGCEAQTIGPVTIPSLGLEGGF